MWVAIAGLVLLAGISAWDRPRPRPAVRAAPAALPTAAPAAATTDATGLLFGRPLDLNRSSARALEALPGIGPGRAAAIVAYRKQHPFERVEDLERVPGIGPRTVAGLAGWAVVSRAGDGGDR